MFVRGRGGDQTGPMCTRLEQPLNLMHMGPVFQSLWLRPSFSPDRMMCP